jgi:hypothetical protein
MEAMGETAAPKGATCYSPIHPIADSSSLNTLEVEEGSSSKR